MIFKFESEDLISGHVNNIDGEISRKIANWETEKEMGICLRFVSSGAY